MASTVTEISPSELAAALPAVLDRVQRRRERFLVVHGGEPIAAIEPADQIAAGAAGARLTLRHFMELLRDAPRPDDRFADDLEAVQAGQPPAVEVRWDS